MRTFVRCAALTLLLTACSEETVELQEQPAKAPPPAAASSAQNAMTVSRADGSKLMTVKFTSEVAELSLFDGSSTRALRGEPRESGKRKYTLDGGEALLEVKPGDEGDFKLRGPDGSLRWKVKIDDQKIRVSDNEQNDRPFELKKREGDRVKVFGPGDVELGNVRVDSAGGRTVVEDASGKELYVVDTSTPSGAWGVLLLDRVPDVQRQVLIAEILARGR
jgi:hypothetical protein